jgi:hypothetical protein
MEGVEHEAGPEAPLPADGDALVADPDDGGVGGAAGEGARTRAPGLRRCRRMHARFWFSSRGSDATPRAGGGADATAVPMSLLTHASERALPCPAGCGASFSRSRLAFHLRSKACAHAATAAPLAAPPLAAGASLACPAPECTHRSPNLKALRKHFSARHAQRSHTCPSCGASFGRSDMLSRHAKACQQPGRLACVCAPSAPFKTLFNLNRHIRAHAAAHPGERHERCEAVGDGAPAAGRKEGEEEEEEEEEVLAAAEEGDADVIAAGDEEEEEEEGDVAGGDADAAAPLPGGL